MSAAQTFDQLLVATRLAKGQPGEAGLGLVNLRRRAEKLHGQFATESESGEGDAQLADAP